MPIVHQAPNSSNTAPHVAVEKPKPAPESEPINTGALVQLENQKRIAIVEKLMGMNKSVIVEKDAQRVGFIYKTVDTSTGEVVRVWPQKEVATALMALADTDAKAMMQGMLVDALV